MHFNSIFYPKSIAVIGASRTPKTVGNDLIKNLVQQGFSGKVYPVNPNADEIYGLPVYHSVSEIPESIDLALVAVPAKFVTQVISEAADKGAKGAIVISAGFKEMGNLELEQELAQVCKDKNIALIGPNCLGVINPEIHMNSSFASIMPNFGDIAFISQSGALCSSVLDYAKEFNLGFSKFMSIGNKALVDEVELLRYFAEDPQTKVIAMYVEQLENANSFIEMAKSIAQSENPKPIIILKSGRTSAGAAAIASHTGSLAGGDSAYQALFAQSGVIRANTIRELFEYIDIFSHNPLVPVSNVAIITNAGGPGVVATDEASTDELPLATISEKTQAQLREFLPAAANVKNPIDILGDAKADRYKQTLEILCNDSEIDSIMVLLTPQSTTEVEETAKAIVELRHQCTKPIVVSFMGKETVDNSIQLLERNGISTTTFPELGLRGLAAMKKFMEFNQQSSEASFAFTDISQEIASSILTIEIENGRTQLPEATALEVFEAYQLPTLKRMILSSAKDVETASSYFTTPVALKIISPDILHKSDAGGVMLNVAPNEIEREFQALLQRVKQNVPDAKLDGVLAVEMAPKGGLELIVGANQVPGLGMMVMVGLGGVYVEVFKDISFGFAPLSQDFTQQMIERLRILPILSGARGQSGYDIPSLIDVIGRVSQLVSDHPEISELDINPLLVLPKGQGVKVLDARIILKEGRG